MVVIHPRLMALLAVAAGATFALAMGYDPQRRSGRLMQHALRGLALLVAWNLAGLPHVGVNPLSAVTAGVLGLPGVGALLAVSLMR